MAPRVVAKTRAIIDKLATIAGMELMVAAQAVDLRKGVKLGAGTKRAYRLGARAVEDGGRGSLAGRGGRRGGGGGA